MLLSERAATTESQMAGAGVECFCPPTLRLAGRWHPAVACECNRSTWELDVMHVTPRQNHIASTGQPRHRGTRAATKRLFEES